MKEKEDYVRNFPLTIQRLREKTILLTARLTLNNGKKGVKNEKNRRTRLNKLG